MKKLLTVLSAVALVAVSGIAVFAASEMREGKWEITSKVEMPGMPMKMAPTVMTHCYTKEDVKDRKNVVSNKNNDCKVTWKMKCIGKSKGTFSGVMVFGSDYYNSTMNMQSEGYNMTTKVKAKRIGNCD